jgi:hypothetical protein
VAYVGNQPARGQWRKLTDISGSFNGVTTTFTTSVPPGTSEYYVTAGSASQLLISLGGVIQQPDTDYTVSTNSITFTTAPTAGLSFFGVLCGDALNTGTPSDGSVTTVKLAGSLSVGLAAGSAAAPSLYFTGDSNNGIYSPSADNLSITTNGTERIRFDSTGQIEAVSLGSASAPTWSYTGDPNTGTFSPGADTWGVSTGGSERLRVDSSGRALVGLTSANANGGILQLSSGITFPATQSASTDPNTLDDYEEGTWTPALADAASGGNEFTYSTQEGQYTKVGNVVTCFWRITWTGKGSAAAGNTLIFRGFPFSVKNNTGQYYNTGVAIGGGLNSYAIVGPTGGQSYGIFTTVAGAAATVSAVAATGTASGSFTYLSA